MADEVQIKFTADAESAVRSVGQLKEALGMLEPALSAFSSSSIRVFRDQMQMLVDMKEMTTQQALGFDVEYTAQLRDQEAQRLQAVISSDLTMLDEKMKAFDDLAQLDEQYTAAVTADQRRIADEAKTQAQAVQRAYEAAFDRLGSSVQRTFNEILTRQTTWAKGSMELVREVDSFFLTEIEDMAAKWAASGLASLAGGAVSSAVSSAQATGASGLGAGLTALIGVGQPGGLFGTGLFSGGAGGAAQSAALTANTTALTATTTAITALTTALTGAAAVSGGSAAASGLGTAAGAAAAGGAAGGGGLFSWLGGLFSFGGGGIVPSAAGGWALPNFAGAQPALLHAREMVLPAPISEGLQGMIGHGGAEQHFHAHFHGPADAPAIGRWFRDNMRQNAGAIRDLFRQNALTPRSL